jgi:uncharacterized protein (TIGR02453 family)
MTFFTDDFLKFFQDLEQNNNKEWFDANRIRYKNSVKEPFYAFVDHMIGLINERDPNVQITAKDAVMRINRDIRFSPDKTPYNIHYGAIISSAGRKDKSIPGFFIRFSPQYIGLFGGAHGIDKDQLQRIRAAIARDIKGFQGLINAENFKTRFGKIRGEQHKRIPAEFREAHQKEPLIANKQFYYMSELDPKIITSPQLPDVLMEYWEAANPVREYLSKALNT